MRDHQLRPAPSRCQRTQLLLAVLALATACASSGSLVGAARSGDTARLSALIEAGADIDETDFAGNAPLMAAVSQGRSAAVELLLAAGADPNTENAFGSTPLHYAAQAGHNDIVRALIAAGARIDARSAARPDDLQSGLGAPAGGNETALQRAAERGHESTVRLLVDLGAELPAPDAVRAAGEAGHMEIAAYLRKAARSTRPPRGPITADYGRRVGAVIGISRYRGWPPLEGAARDARQVASALRSLGFDQVYELYDEQATRTAALRLLGDTLPRGVGPDDLVFIYFAGHGQTETLANGERRGYIIPVDASTQDSFATGISMDTLRDIANRLTARHVYYVMDSCYSGLGLATEGTDVRARGNAKARSIQMLTAGSEGQQAQERGGRGLFTTYLLRALEGEADLNEDGVMSASEIGLYVAPQVSAASRNEQTPRYGRIEGTGELALEVP